MYSVNETQDMLKIKLSSEMGMVDRVIKDSTEFIRNLRYEKLETMKTVIRELLINAIEHGNNKEIQKTVDCTIEHLGDARFKIEIIDQGSGFDHSKIDLLIPDSPDQYRNRGLPLVNALADSLSFNDSGNAAIAHLTIPIETDFKVDDQSGRQHIKPTGNLTASSADRFRIVLLELLEKDFKHFEFDLSDVDDIDSISLSLLITFAKMLQKKHEDCTLAILNANKDLVSLFELTRLNRIYTISTTGD